MQVVVSAVDRLAGRGLLEYVPRLKNRRCSSSGVTLALCLVSAKSMPITPTLRAILVEARRVPARHARHRGRRRRTDSALPGSGVPT